MLTSVSNQLSDIGVTPDELLIPDDDVTTNLQERLTSATVVSYK